MLSIRGAQVVWTGADELPGVDVRCAAGQVQTLAPPAHTPGDEVLDASGCVVVPGLVNAHHHLLQSAFRTDPAARHVPMAQWLAAMRAQYAGIGIDGPLASAAAAVGLAESLLCGVTTVADHHLNWPDSTDACIEVAEATISQALELGARLVFVRGTAGDDPHRAVATVEHLHRAHNGGRVSIGVGPSGVHADGPETFAALADVAKRLGLRRRTQANEQVDVAIALDRYGRRPLELLEAWDWLAPDVTVAHCCDVDEGEIARLSAREVSVTHAPGCDLPQGWGIAPAGRMLDADIAVGLGTSGGGSNDAGHLLADARLAMQVSALTGRSLTAREVLRMASAGSAVGLGRDDLGVLVPGAAADLCCYEITGVADAGVADPVAGLVWATPGRRPRHVVVDGTVVVRDWQLVTGDECEIAARLRELLAARRRAR
ncbi:MAG TPA: amidohydrolase family protein [Acidimicrobiales bacterium]|nr:amidohydrolase family protein [Acidimicrobiales bacterium]